MHTYESWRLIYDGECESAWNMAVDEALLRSVANEESGPVLRMYGWKSASVSLGRFQSVERTMHREATATAKISVVRRITGGRGILHGDDLTISLATPIAALGLPTHTTISAFYDPIAAAFGQAFAELGLEVCQGHFPTIRAGDTRGDCFATISRADLVDRTSGIKLLGSALHRKEDVILLQASLPLRTPQNRTWVQHLGKELFRGASPQEESLLPSIDAASARSALIRAFARQFCCDFAVSQLTRQEEQSVHHLMQIRYASSDWTRDAVGTSLPVAIDS